MTIDEIAQQIDKMFVIRDGKLVSRHTPIQFIDYYTNLLTYPHKAPTAELLNKLKRISIARHKKR